ncbi:MAG TPA: tRNA (adenosine(37)-N6)-dimethylallyltransferase MiaA [Anaeromyxobacteraceae bacterium]|nr:tRNA (adenosine(37)-N6)-dimethylallyltransferase MiaA [Anaeromyxobacteraceae bacterium]
MAPPTRIVVIAGPTASGKTALAVELCRRLGGEVVSADSQQIYRGLDVGTAKPTAEERAAVPHHLIDVAAPGEGWDAARFVRAADGAITEIAGRGRVPVVVGGTGLYLRALLHGVVDAPGRDPELRARLEEEARVHGRPAVHASLAQVDPEAASRIRPNDLVRVVRALEIAASGRTQTERFREHAFAPDRYAALLFALGPSREELHRRIDARVEAMFAGGLLDEARALVERFGERLPAKLPIGYADAIALLRGECTRAEAVHRVQVETRRYARRQVIWLRRERGIEWLTPPWDVEELARRVNGL